MVRNQRAIPPIQANSAILQGTSSRQQVAVRCATLQSEISGKVREARRAVPARSYVGHETDAVLRRTGALMLKAFCRNVFGKNV